MDMVTPVHEQRLFFTTGQCRDAGLEAVAGRSLRPAILARYRDLARLRYDFPLVLVTGGAADGDVRSLASVVDEVLGALAPRGIDGERLRRHVLRLEREIRTRAVAGHSGRLSDLWSTAAAELARPDDPSVEHVLAYIAGKLGVDGDVVDCDAALPTRVVEHCWRAEQARKARAFHATVGRLVVRLADILRGAFLHSDAGQQPASLRASLGGTHRELFDFDTMSRLVRRTAAHDELPPARRARIEGALRTLEGQRFHPDPRREADAGAAFAFRFDDCASAAEAFRARLPDLVAVAKAIAVAELEVDGRYVEATHDPVFERFDAAALSAEDLALFPDYLVCIAPGRENAPGNAGLLDHLSAGLPLKVLVQTADLVEDAAPGDAHFAFGVRSMRLANMVTALGGVFVVQAPASHLYAMRGSVVRALAHRGAALLSVYAGAPEGVLPPYLAAAAALEARVFPAFTYDPHAGDNQAARFSLESNPQPEADWPVAELEYADEGAQRVREAVAFSMADFALCDPRYAAHFARVPRERWNAALVPADEWLARDAKHRSDAIPCVLAVDDDDVLHRVIVDGRLMQVAARVRTFWHRLQEQGGIHNSHAELLLAREKARWEAAQAKLPAEAAPSAASGAAVTAAATIAAAATAPSAAAEPATPAPEATAPARNPDEAWIETSRCPSCNECQVINDRMFRYNENKQAYIADITAGTFRQLVEAAESCQVAIIHPGKPRNPDEPGLAELVERAQPFLD